MHEILRRLIKLRSKCQKISTPQKWIGSSVCLGFDCEMIPKRSENVEEEIREGVIAYIFDWARSELTLESTFAEMSKSQQESRRKSWENYLFGVNRLSFCAFDTYRNRFGVTCWKQLSLCVYDDDFLVNDDFLGKITIPLQETQLKAYKLGNRLQKMVFRLGKIYFSIQYQEYPLTSRLVGAWRVYVQKAEGLIRSDITSLSDPYVLVIAESLDGLRFEQSSCTEKDNQDPVWEETFEIPIAKSSNEIRQIFDDEGVLFHPEEWSTERKSYKTVKKTFSYREEDDASFAKRHSV